jgi:hypothetical protein
MSGGSKRVRGFTLVAPNLNYPEMIVVGAPPPPYSMTWRKVEAFFASRGTDKRAGRGLLPDCRQLSRNRITEGFGGGLLFVVE